jgi:hypothetical protein
MADRFIANPEGFDIDELIHLQGEGAFTGKIRICGNIMDSNTEKNVTFMPKKCYNIRNIEKCANNTKDSKYILYFGPRDINKIKIMALTEMVASPDSSNNSAKDYAKNFIKSYTDTYNTFVYPNETILENINFAVKEMDKTFFTFWNTHDKGIDVANRIKSEGNKLNNCKFLKRFIEIFYDIDAMNLLFSIPYELIEYCYNIEDTNKEMYNEIDKEIFAKGKFEEVYKNFITLLNEKKDIINDETIEKLDKLAFYTIVAFRKMLNNGQPPPKKDSERSMLDGLLFKMFTNTKNCLVDAKEVVNNSILSIISYGGINKHLAKNGKKPLEKLYKKLQSFEQLYRAVFNKNRYIDDYKYADQAEWTGRRSFSPYGERHLPIIIQQQSNTAHMLDEKGVPTNAPAEYIDEDKEAAQQQSIKKHKEDLVLKPLFDRKQELRTKYILNKKKYFSDVGLNQLYIGLLNDEINEAEKIEDFNLFEQKREIDNLIIKISKETDKQYENLMLDKDDIDKFNNFIINQVISISLETDQNKLNEEKVNYVDILNKLKYELKLIQQHILRIAKETSDAAWAEAKANMKQFIKQSGKAISTYIKESFETLNKTIAGINKDINNLLINKIINKYLIIDGYLNISIGTVFENDITRRLITIKGNLEKYINSADPIHSNLAITNMLILTKKKILLYKIIIQFYKEKEELKEEELKKELNQKLDEIDKIKSIAECELYIFNELKEIKKRKKEKAAAAKEKAAEAKKAATEAAAADRAQKEAEAAAAEKVAAAEAAALTELENLSTLEAGSEPVGATGAAGAAGAEAEEAAGAETIALAVPPATIPAAGDYIDVTTEVEPQLRIVIDSLGKFNDIEKIIDNKTGINMIEHIDVLYANVFEDPQKPLRQRHNIITNSFNRSKKNFVSKQNSIYNEIKAFKDHINVTDNNLLFVLYIDDDPKGLQYPQKSQGVNSISIGKFKEEGEIISYEEENSNYNLDIDNLSLSNIPTNANFGVVKLPKDETGLFENPNVYKNILKIINKIKVAGKNLLLITDFDSTLTRIHLYWSLYGAKTIDMVKDMEQYKEFITSFGPNPNHQEVYNSILISNDPVKKDQLKEFYFHKEGEEYIVNTFFKSIKDIYEPGPQSGGYIYDRKHISKLDVDIKKNCKEINTYFMNILTSLLRSTSFEDDIKSPIPSPKMVFIMILMEYYYCNSKNYNGANIDCKGISNNDTFSTKIISPLVSDLYSLRYDSLNTECFRSSKYNVVLQIIGHSNNYFDKTTYKKDKYNKDNKQIYFYGGVVDIYGNYKSKSKAMIVCLDNSSFFNSVIEDNYKSRAYLSFDSNHSIFKSIQRGGNDPDEDEGGDEDEEGGEEDKDKEEESKPNKDGKYPEEYLSAFKLHNFIAFYTTPQEIQKAITNSTKLNSPIKIEIDLYTVLLNFKQIKHYAHANYYGSTDYNMILSTIGIEGRARHGMSRKEMREIQGKKQEVLDSTIGTRLNKIIETRDLSLTSVQKSVKDAVLIQRKIRGVDTFSVNDYINDLKLKKNLHKTDPDPTSNKPLTAEEEKHLTVQPIAA